REYWVIDADTLVTTVGLNPSQDGFGERREVHYSDIVTPSLAPELAICLSNLGLQPLSET
ncbi:MAG: Uma2 family endonuclease, partial [Pseudomonadota bacterium]